MSADATALLQRSPPISYIAEHSYVEILGWLVLYTVVVAVAFALGHGVGDLHNDVLEAYAWGQELQLGYHKHPPLWGWAAYAWFSVFPRTALSGYLLGTVNAAIGLCCTWLIGRRYLPSAQASAVMLCLMTTTMFLCFAERFNANTVLLSLWPATTLAVLKAAETERIKWGAFAGVLVSLCLLSKYQSVVFLVALLLSLYAPERKAAVYRSAAAIACYLVAGALITPHLVWLARHDFLPLRYADVTTVRPFMVTLRETILFPVVSTLFLAPAVFVYARAAGWSARDAVEALGLPLAGDRSRVAIIAFGPLVLTMAICLLRSGTFKPLYATPMFFMVPIWFAMAPIPVSPDLLRRVRNFCRAVLAGCLALSPLVGGAAFFCHAPFISRPKAEVVQAVTKEWHRRFGSPLAIVGGTEDYAIAAPFYGADHPSYLIGLDQKVLRDFDMPLGKGPTDAVLMHSPWVTRARIARQGLAVICSQEPARQGSGCDEEAEHWIGARGESFDLILAKSFLGGQLPSYQFRIYLRPPAPLGYDALPLVMGPKGPFTP